MPRPRSGKLSKSEHVFPEHTIVPPDIYRDLLAYAAFFPGRDGVTDPARLVVSMLR
ncbi:DUF2274 domain-containing protein [Acetobacter orientalis]|uniref:DUF2274 domain-containing protein n=1 Tax=Acetobacter orientalis TaxID=146474 RepID=UPI0039EC3B09